MNTDRHLPSDEGTSHPPSALGLVNVVLLLLITAVGGLGLAAVTSQYFADQELVLASHPFAHSKILVMSHHEIIREIGPILSSDDTGASKVHWNYPNAGSADIHLRVAGEKGTVVTNLLWSRIDGNWLLLSANWIDVEGSRRDIPLGPNGRFLSEEEWQRYQQADPLTPEGRGQRALLEGDYSLAIEEFNEALLHSPGQVDVLMNRGVAFLHVGNRPSAIADFKAVLTIEPNHARANQTMSELSANTNFDENAAQPTTGQSP